MANLVSRVAVVVTISYTVVIAVLLIVAWHFAAPEARAFDLLFIGFPWVLATVHFRNDSLWLYFFAVILNVVSVYVFVLALVKVSSSRK
jgi:hypothetical protein